jgi:hypothetical protein
VTLFPRTSTKVRVLLCLALLALLGGCVSTIPELPSTLTHHLVEGSLSFEQAPSPKVVPTIIPEGADDEDSLANFTRSAQDEQSFMQDLGAHLVLGNDSQCVILGAHLSAMQPTVSLSVQPWSWIIATGWIGFDPAMRIGGDSTHGKVLGGEIMSGTKTWSIGAGMGTLDVSRYYSENDLDGGLVSHYYLYKEYAVQYIRIAIGMNWAGMDWFSMDMKCGWAPQARQKAYFQAAWVFGLPAKPFLFH